MLHEPRRRRGPSVGPTALPPTGLASEVVERPHDRSTGRCGTVSSAVPFWWTKRNYDPLLHKARVPLGEVAFANVAKCRTVTEDDSAASVRLAQACAAAYPPSELIRLLQPAAVLLASLRLDVGETGDVKVIRWNGRTGVDENRHTMKNWIEIEATKLHRARNHDRT